MFNKILVPLDGSQQAEVTLPVVAYFASKCHSEITLLHVVERHPPTRIHGQRHLANAAEAMKYLKDLTLVMKQSCKKVTLRVIDEPSDQVADSIVAAALSGDGYDLIAVCKHDQRPFSGGIKNCLARQVASKVKIPLLVKCASPDEVNSRYQPLHISFLVDAFTDINHPMEIVKNIALKCGLHVSLVVAYPQIRAMGYLGTGLGSALNWAIASTNREIEDEVGFIVRTCELEFNRSGLQVVSSVVPYRSSSQLAGLLTGMASDLIVMGMPDIKRQMPTKIFDISRNSRLPSLLIPA